MNATANGSPELMFVPGTSSGFTPAGVAAFDDLHPAAVVRELIQNCLDAARLADVEPAKVRFRFSRIDRKEVPEIENYKIKFNKAVRSHLSGTGSQAKQVIRRISDALNQSELDVLSVLDNGIGLDQLGMDALLSDGVSYKKDSATGSYGNGHYTAISASNLRYVLYGGVTKNGTRICSGHAVIASHLEENEEQIRSGDGFLITGFNAGKDGLFDYAKDSSLPDLISKDLDAIENDFGHGSTVIIPAFNNFLEKESLWEMVSYAVSANFFGPIADGELEVEVEIDTGRPGDDGIWELNRDNLEHNLRRHCEKKGPTKFVNGSLAYDAFRTYVLRQPRKVKNRLGTVDVRIREVPTGTTRVHLCRNGMWITDNIPCFGHKFSNRVSFNAIVSLTATEGQKLYSLIRDAEGPLHNQVLLKGLPSYEQKRCRKALRRIVSWILENTTEINSEAYFSDDFLVLNSGDELGGRGNSHPGFIGTPVIVNRYPVRQLRENSGPEDESGLEPSDLVNQSNDNNPPNRVRKRRRPTLPALVQAVSRPLERNRRRILIECINDVADAELRLVVDEALDATCDRPGQDAYIPAILSNVRVDGNLVNERLLSRMDGKTVGVLLGDLSANRMIEIETNYELQGDFTNLRMPSLRVEVFKCHRDADTQEKSKLQQDHM